MTDEANRKKAKNIFIPQPRKYAEPEKRSSDAGEGWRALKKRLSQKAAVPHALMTATVPAPPSIAELARALKNDVDLIYEWVYGNIDWYCMWGSHKSALGAIIDSSGNSFEQSAAMVALLRQAGYTANFACGSIRLSKSQIENLLGTVETDTNHSSEDLIKLWGQIPATFVYDEMTDVLLYADIDHVWVQVDIGGTDYVFDPSFKTYDYTVGIDIGAIVGFDGEELLEDAQEGSTSGSSYLQNLNLDGYDTGTEIVPGIRTHFKTYGTNLLSWLRSNAYHASMDDIIGGREIHPLESQPVRQTSLPYQTPDTTPTIVSSITEEYRATYKITVKDNDGGAPISLDSGDLYTDEIYGKRLTITINSSIVPILKLDGETQVTGSSALTEDAFAVATISIIHPFEEPFFNEIFDMGVWANEDSLYVLGNQYGQSSQSMAEFHRQQQLQNTADGALPTDESVLGESLETLFFTINSQGDMLSHVFEQLSSCLFFNYHYAGFVAYTTFFQGPIFDLQGSYFAVSKEEDDTVRRNVFASSGIYRGAFEGSVMQQSFGNAGLSAPNMLVKALEQGQEIYSWDIFNGSTVNAAIINYSSEQRAIFATLAGDGWTIVLPKDGETTVGSYVGAGWYEIFLPGIATPLHGQILGGGLDEPIAKDDIPEFVKRRPPKPEPQPPVRIDLSPRLPDIDLVYRNLLAQHIQPIPPRQGTGDLAIVDRDPVETFSGSFNYNVTDMTVGSSVFPYALSFSRNYSSARRFQDSPLGNGWTHNLDAKLQVSSSGLQPCGSFSPLEAAGTIAYVYAMLQLSLGDWVFDGDDELRQLIATVGTQWLMDELFSNNVVTISNAGDSGAYIKLVDGTYNSPPSARATLEFSGGTFSLTSPQKLVWNFNEDNQLETYVDPAGVTVTYTYVDGLLYTVSNGMGRTLTLSHDMEERLESVTDGDRTILFTVDEDGNLTEATDAESKTTTYEYDHPSLMTKIFLPANPETAYLENSYDSLGRINGQTLANCGEAEFYIAGSRSEVVDPLGNSNITYYQANGSAQRQINALGQATTYERDGLNRMTKATLPELNSIEYEYDENNNLLSKTSIPKPGSSLDNIVESFTYDPDWNKVATSEDGEGNIITFTLDPVTGSLLTITRPEIDSLIPTITNTYTARGQIETRTENRDADSDHDITDKFIYSSTDETLEQSIRNYTADPGDGLNLTTAFGYNAWGDVNSITDPRGNETIFEFDNERRMIQRTECSPFGFITNWEFNENGFQLSVARQTGDIAHPYQIWSTSYRANNSVESTTDPDGNVTTMAYNTDNWLISTTDAEGRTWQFTHDQLGRVVVTTDPLGNAFQTNTFTANGMLATITDARNNTTEMAYDGFDRLDTRTYPDETFEQMTYNKNNQVLTLLTRAGDTIENSYDVLTRLETRQPGSLPLQTMTYDLSDRLTSISTPVVGGDPSSGEFSFSHDSAGRLISQTMPNTAVVGYQLDENGNRTRLTWPDSFYAEYVFDQMNRLTDIKLNGDSSSVINIAYDELSRQETLTYINGASCDYSYATNNDMTSLEHTFVGSSVAFAFGYNKVHQVTSASADNDDFVWMPTVLKKTRYATANNLNQYPAVAGDAYHYNNNGNLESGPFTSADFDELNRLTQAVNLGVTVDYWIDPQNRQVQKEVDSLKTRFLYDGVQIIAQTDDSDVLVNRYIPGAGLDDILIEIDASDEVTFLHKDRIGSVIAQTDVSGAVLNKYVYSPYGETANLDGTIFGFTGQRYDAEIGLYNYKARYYLPAVGRFLQADPVGFSAGMNLYSYVGNDPANSTDFLGLTGEQLSDGIYTYSKILNLHAGIIVVDKGQITTIDGAYSVFPFLGDLQVHYNTKLPKEIVGWSHINKTPLTQDPDKIAAIKRNAEELYVRLQEQSLDYSILPPFPNPNGHTSNEVWGYLLRSVDITPPALFTPGTDLTTPLQFAPGSEKKLPLQYTGPLRGFVRFEQKKGGS